MRDQQVHTGSEPRRRPRMTRITVVLAACWVAAVGFGMWRLAMYEHRPGAAAMAQVTWPSNTTIPKAEASRTLLFWVHPQCACSRSSAAELARFVARYRDQAAIRVLVYQPQGQGADWRDTAVLSEVRRIPGAEIIPDVDGVEARLFGARISGEIMLYGVDGMLQFQGGITGSRAHEGDNTGRELLVRRLHYADPPLVRVPTFGCSLVASNADEGAGP